VNIHTVGCGLNCKGCIYKLRERENRKRVEAGVTVETVEKVLRRLDVRRVHFLGGEPTICPELGPIAEFCHEELGVRTKIGHSAGLKMPPNNIDEMNFTIKAVSDSLHREYTGSSNREILKNFRGVYKRGIHLSANTVLIPGFVDVWEVERIAGFIADIDPGIPLHITGYIPVPGTPWRAPHPEEMEKAKKVAENHLETVTTSLFRSMDEYSRIKSMDPRYGSVRVV